MQAASQLSSIWASDEPAGAVFAVLVHRLQRRTLIVDTPAGLPEARLRGAAVATNYWLSFNATYRLLSMFGNCQHPAPRYCHESFDMLLFPQILTSLRSVMGGSNGRNRYSDHRVCHFASDHARGTGAQIINVNPVAARASCADLTPITTAIAGIGRSSPVILANRQVYPRPAAILPLHTDSQSTSAEASRDVFKGTTPDVKFSSLI